MYEYRILVAPNLESDFKSLVSDLKTIGYVPVIVKGREPGSDYVISVIKRRRSKPFGVWVNIVLLVGTLISTIYVGEQLYVGYFDIAKFSMVLYFYGFLYFALPLLIILGAHELGHFFMAKRNGVAASLPFFMPAPFTLLGTLGAFISLRDPLPDRKTLIKIGAAGPLVGFVMSIVVGIIGAFLGTIQQPVNVTSSQDTYLISLPIIYHIFPAIQAKYVHPVAFAAWVGFLVTAINLFPVGQLDGGHVARGLLGDKAKYLSYAFIVILIVIGIYYVSWILFAIIIIILGLNHPPPLNDISKPGKREIMVGLVAIALVAICFSPIPFTQNITPNTATTHLSEGNYFAIYGNPIFNADALNLMVNNSNNYSVNLGVTIKVPIGLNSTPSFNETMSPNEKTDYSLRVWPTNNYSKGTYNFTVRVVISGKSFNFQRNVSVVSLNTNITLNNQNPYYTGISSMNLHLSNSGPAAFLEVYRFNSSSFFYINGTTGFGTSGEGTFLKVPSKGELELSAFFYDASVPGGIVLLDKSNGWRAVFIFYVPPTSAETKDLTWSG